MNKPKGYTLYVGPSLLDGAPIVAIATLKTSNRKIGDMVQAWILRDDINPVKAVATGADATVCGDCPLRGNGRGGQRACYVNVGQAPAAVWKAYKRGLYPAAGSLAAIGAGRRVRLGAYGDPAAVPADIWEALVSRADGHTGYTHQWRQPLAAPLRGFVMASADDAPGAIEAQAAGWRTFRVTRPGESLAPREVECPATTRGVSCADCLLCSGADKLARNVAILAHGPGAKWA